MKTELEEFLEKRKSIPYTPVVDDTQALREYNASYSINKTIEDRADYLMNLCIDSDYVYNGEDEVYIERIEKDKLLKVLIFLLERDTELRGLKIETIVDKMNLDHG